MRIDGRIILIAIGLTAAIAAAGWTGAAASRQATCSASDTACRLAAIEARLARIERSGGGGEVAAVNVAADRMCQAGHDCQPTAASVCSDSGFARGVPAQTEYRGSLTYLVVATCLGAGGAGPNGVTMASEEMCQAGHDCQPTAARVCSASGFARGVPARTEDRGSLKYLVAATCLD